LTVNVAEGSLPSGAGKAMPAAVRNADPTIPPASTAKDAANGKEIRLIA
jgi:hypothetical protein